MKGLSQIKSRLGQGRAGFRQKIKLPMSPLINKPIVKLKKKTNSTHARNGATKNNFKCSSIHDKVILQTRSSNDSGFRLGKRKTMQDISREIPMYPDSMYRPPPKPTEIPFQEIFRNLSDLDMDIKENSPYQEGVISKMYQRPDKLYFQEPQELDILINTGKLVHPTFLQEQADIDNILEIIQRKVPAGTHLP